jgi:hypothetical protein
MNNKVTSPLYIYTKNAIDSGVNVRHLQTALAAVNNVVDNCCTTRHKVSKTPFLNTFYTLLNGMNKKNAKHKYEAVKAILEHKITCCGITIT